MSDNAKRIEEYKDTFRLFDKNGNGEIEVHELNQVMQSLGQNPTVKDVENMIKEFDLNKDGTINFDEFVKMMDQTSKPPAQRELELKAAFMVFDQNKDGKISAQELKNVMTKMGDKLTDEEVADMISEVDLNNDGFVDYEEFVHMYTSP